jgi:hypothetical protein
MYRVLGPCCRLYDREQLPWPCCRIEWHSKEPSWRRIGKRFILDMASREHPSYSVEMIGIRATPVPIILTLYSVQLTPPEKTWWYGIKPKTRQKSDTPSKSKRSPSTVSKTTSSS